MKKIAVSLLSGGLDSCVASTLAKSQGFDLYLLSIHYGQVMSKELESAKRIAEILQPIEHKILHMNGFNQISRSSRTDSKLIEYDRNVDEEIIGIPDSYPPGRDTSFILIASAWLESLMLKDVKNIEYGKIFIGTNKNDSDVFPDCKNEVYNLMNQILKVSTKVSNQFGKEMNVETPLIDMTKDEVVKLGVEIGAPIEESWSCYEGKDLACGRCDPCNLRLWAFEQAGFQDHIKYRTINSLVESLAEDTHGLSNVAL